MLCSLATQLLKVYSKTCGWANEYLVAGLVRLDKNGRAIITLHLGSLDHLVGRVNVLGVVLVVVDLRKDHT